eukprot:GHVT01045858.1.p1 GENE.GHVT01045858.1~~GHVT01045858.1.p1  ORF type:complete len:240 (+),score=13.49 GHVT01045858.1:901-1620(+)
MKRPVLVRPVYKILSHSSAMANGDNTVVAGRRVARDVPLAVRSHALATRGSLYTGFSSSHDRNWKLLKPNKKPAKKFPWLPVASTVSSVLFAMLMINFVFYSPVPPPHNDAAVPSEADSAAVKAPSGAPVESETPPSKAEIAELTCQPPISEHPLRIGMPTLEELHSWIVLPSEVDEQTFVQLLHSRKPLGTCKPSHRAKRLSNLKTNQGLSSKIMPVVFLVFSIVVLTLGILGCVGAI